MRRDGSGNPEPREQYKSDVEDLLPEHADRILDLRPIWYRSACHGDNPAWSWYGLGAEEVAEIDPRYVFWSPSGTRQVQVAEAQPEQPAVMETQPDPDSLMMIIDGRAQHIGTIQVEIEPATPARPAEYRTEPDPDSPMVPSGVAYERLVVPLISIARRERAARVAMEARLTEMMDRITAMEARLAALER